MKHWACHCSNKVTTNDAQVTPPVCTRELPGEPPHGPMTLLRTDATAPGATPGTFASDGAEWPLGMGALRCNVESAGGSHCLLPVRHPSSHRDGRGVWGGSAAAPEGIGVTAEFMRERAAQAVAALGPPIKVSEFHGDLSCNHEAELGLLRSGLEVALAAQKKAQELCEALKVSAKDIRVETMLLRDQLGSKDATIAELQREVGRQSLELRRSRR